MRKLSTYLGAAIIVGIFVSGFIAYFLFSFDPVTKQTFDGFGRPLSESPLFMRVILGEDREWAGWFWFVADMVIFWGGIAIGFALINFGQGDRK